MCVETAKLQKSGSMGTPRWDTSTRKKLVTALVVEEASCLSRGTDRRLRTGQPTTWRTREQKGREMLQFRKETTRNIGFQSPSQNARFDSRFQHPWFGGQEFGLSPINADEWAEKKLLFDDKSGAMWPLQAVPGVERKSTREQILVQFWTSHVRDEFDVANSIQRKATLSCATAVLNRVRGWRFGNEQDSQIGVKFAVCLWVCTKAVICKDNVTWNPSEQARFS